MKKILHIDNEIKQQLKKSQLVVPTSNNHIFDILADRCTEYAVDLPKSKYNNIIIREMTFREYCKTKFNGQLPHRDRTDHVWVIDYNENTYPKLSETYIKNYLVKKLNA